MGSTTYLDFLSLKAHKSMYGIDDETYLHQKLELTAPGTITVKMFRVRITNKSIYPTISGTAPPERITVHEKSKKVGGHATVYVEFFCAPPL